MILFTDMLKDLAVLSPVIAILIIVIIYLCKQIDKKTKMITTLNKEIRDSEKSTMELLNTLSSTLEHLSKSSDGNSHNIERLTDEIRGFKHDLEQRLIDINMKLN